MKLEFRDYRIVSDERQYVVQKKRVTETEDGEIKESYDNEAYCRTLEYAIKHIGNKVLLDNNDLEVIRKELRLLRLEIKKFIALMEVETE